MSLAFIPRRVLKARRRRHFLSFGWMQRRRARRYHGATGRDELRPATRAIPPEELYPRGPNRGFMIWMPVIDERRPRPTPHYVLLEMVPPDPIAGREGWHAVQPCLGATAAAAALGMPMTTFRKFSRKFVSRRELLRRVYFVTAELYEIDIPALERGAYGSSGEKGLRQGRHGLGCRNRQHVGKCVPQPTRTPARARRSHAGTRYRGVPVSPGWHAVHGRSKYDRTASPEITDESAGANLRMARQPVTVATIHEVIPATDAGAREAMYAAHADEVAEEIAAGRFVPEGEEVP